MNLYKFHDHPKTLHRHDDADKQIASVVMDRYMDSPKELKQRESALAQDAFLSYHYATTVLKDRFEAGEDAIATDAEYAMNYADTILKGPFPKGEKAIATSSYCSLYYALDSLDAPFPDGEKIIASSPRLAHTYVDAFPERKEAIAKLQK